MTHWFSNQNQEMYSLTRCMTVILCRISQDCILLLGFEIETKFSFELILCSRNKLLVSYILKSLDLQDKKLVLFREPQTFLMYWSTIEKYKVKSF